MPGPHEPLAEAARLGELLAHDALVPPSWAIVYTARHDAVLNHIYRSVVIHPTDVDPETFTFGTPGAFASITVNDGRAYPQGTYLVHVMSTTVGFTFQQAGHAVAFTDPAEAVQVAVWQVRMELESHRDH